MVSHEKSRLFVRFIRTPQGCGENSEPWFELCKFELVEILFVFTSVEAEKGGLWF